MVKLEGILKAITGIGILLLTTSACQKSSAVSNLVQWHGQTVDRKLASDGVTFRVVSKAQLSDNFLTRLNLSLSPDNTALVLGFPRQLIGQRNVFGGIVTGVSSTDNPSLGMLKLSNISPLNVTTVLSADGANLVLNGCDKDCEEGSAQTDLFKIPVVKQDADFIYLDLATFGSSLDFLSVSTDFPNKATSTVVTGFDFSLSTLVFDVQNTYLNDAFPTPFTLTVRWYLKLASSFHSNFMTREQRPEVGFFMTERSKTPLITRWAESSDSKSLAKYYIKNVPSEYRQAFADSFDNWNKNVGAEVGKNVLEYEFLETTDPRFNQINTGDVRYNVLEWDLVNLAPYGGLGPSNANQETGEIFSANVLIQGPTIIQLYKKWWKVATAAKALEDQGQTRIADKLRRDFMVARNELVSPAREQFRLGLTSSLPFKIPARDPKLFDPALDGNDFYDTPAGYTFDTYMYGYFRDMVAHELGHNLGLRHNFRGNFGSDDSQQIGTVSRSVMEYLGREFRYLDRIGAYDLMAISYGYKGVVPEHKDWFCTDEDVVSSDDFTHSAECSSNDATTNPFAFFIRQFEKLKSFLILPGSELAPIWDVASLKAPITLITKELANYYVSSYATAGQWTNFTPAGGPVAKELVPGFILKTLEDEICDPSLETQIAKKTPAAQAVARKNLTDLWSLIKTTTASYNQPVSSFTAENFSCLGSL